MADTSNKSIHFCNSKFVRLPDISVVFLIGFQVSVHELQIAVFVLGKRLQQYCNPAADFAFLPLGKSESVRDMRLVLIRIDYIIDNLVKQLVKHFLRRIQQHRAGIAGTFS